MKKLSIKFALLGLLLAASGAAIADPAPTLAEKHLMASGVQITHRFDSVSGLRAIVADNGKDKRLFYVTPDGKSLIAGLVFDASGRNVTSEDMARAGINNSGRTTTITQLQAQKIWQRVQGLKALKDGDRGNVVYAFIDPRCTFCHRFMGMARPHIAAGRLQMRWLPVTILSESSKGLAESLYRASNAGLAIQHLANNALQGLPESPAVRLSLARNLLAMRDTGETGVPLFVYKVGARVIISPGVPSDAELATMVKGK
jgi:thiol:disulfide interchange protein DsbG